MLDCPNHIDARLSRGWVWLSLGNTKHSFIDFSKVLEKEPSNVIALTGCAKASIELGYYDIVIATCNAILLLEPKNSIALIGRGRAHLAKGIFDASINDFSTALGIDSHNVEAVLYRGEAYRNLGQKKLIEI